MEDAASAAAPLPALPELAPLLSGLADYSEGWIVAALLAAILLFWVVGAYNRLLGLRNDIAAAWAKVQQALQQRAGAVAPLLAALREPMAAEHGALDALLVTHAEAQRVATLMGAAPVSAAHAQTWVAAESALAAAASRVVALLAHDPVLGEREEVATALADWTAGQQRLPFVRQLFNESAGAYNEALALFPTRWVARAFSFRPAGAI